MEFAELMIELYYWEGMDGPAIGDVMGMPAPSVRTRLRRARERLGQLMAELTAEPGGLRRTVEGIDAWAAELRARLLPRSSRPARSQSLRLSRSRSPVSAIVSTTPNPASEPAASRPEAAMHRSRPSERSTITSRACSSASQHWRERRADAPEGRCHAVPRSPCRSPAPRSRP